MRLVEDLGCLTDRALWALAREAKQEPRTEVPYLDHYGLTGPGLTVIAGEVGDSYKSSLLRAIALRSTVPVVFLPLQDNDAASGVGKLIRVEAGLGFCEPLADDASRLRAFQAAGRIKQRRGLSVCATDLMTLEIIGDVLGECLPEDSAALVLIDSLSMIEPFQSNREAVRGLKALLADYPEVCIIATACVGTGGDLSEAGDADRIVYAHVGEDRSRDFDEVFYSMIKGQPGLFTLCFDQESGALLPEEGIRVP